MRKKSKMNISNIYMIIILLITSITIISYSYAKFSVQKEKKNAINIKTGSLNYQLDINQIEIDSGKEKVIDIVLTSLNNIESNYQLYFTRNDSVEILYDSIKDTPYGMIGLQNDKKIITLKIMNSGKNKQTVFLNVAGGLPGKNLIIDENVKKITNPIAKIRSYKEVGAYNSGHYYTEQLDFHADEYRTKITKIITKDDLLLPNTIIKSWDVSMNEDGGVLAYIEDDGNNGYQLTIAGSKEIFLPDDAGFLFLNFETATEIDLSYFNTSNTTKMHCLFTNCTGLINVNISNFNTSKVTSFQDMFYGCSSLKSIDLSSFDTSNAETLWAMFYKCLSLESLDLSKFNTSKVTSFTHLFNGCSSLTQLDLTSFDTSNVTEAPCMFMDCTNLKIILVNKDFNITNATKYNLFTNCGTSNFTVV